MRHLEIDCRKLAEEVEKLQQENKDLINAVLYMRKNFEIFKESQKQAEACRYCKFYRQHYGKIDGEYYALYCGHCCRGRIRGKKPLDKCEYFEVRESAER